MGNFQSIEDKLNRLVPPSVSEAGQGRLEETIDQLARVTPHPDVEPGGVPADTTGNWPWKATAALALLAVPAVMFKPGEAPSNPSLASNHPAAEAWNNPVLVVLKTTNRIDGSEDDGLIIPDDGSIPHFRYRYHVTDEELVRDPETGTVITLRQPRQEVVTIPVTEF